MFVLVRAITYATVFIGFVLVFMPARVLSWSGLSQPGEIGLAQLSGIIITVGGALITLWCVLAFVSLGKGTPAPFDPPRRLVIRGPYRFVRNPMYIGAGVALAGAALFYQSVQLLMYTCLFFLVFHFFVILYEEPTLRSSFGQEYNSYCQSVRRWWPKL